MKPAIPTPEDISVVAQVIQLSLAPVFLLTGVSGMLNVMAGRLARVVDRGRALAEGATATLPDGVVAEVVLLERRRHLISVAITACVVAALLVCMVIPTLFLDAVLHAPLDWLIATLFTAGTLALVTGLAFFLREVHLATQTSRLPVPRSR